MLRRDDLDLRAVRELAGESTTTPFDLRREGVRGEPLADRGREIGRGRAVGELALRSVGEENADRVRSIRTRDSRIISRRRKGRTNGAPGSSFWGETEGGEVVGANGFEPLTSSV